MLKNTTFALLLLIVWACHKEAPDTTIIDPPFDPFQAVSEHLSVSKTAPDFGFQLPTWLKEYQPTIPANNNLIELGRVIFTINTCRLMAKLLVHPVTIKRMPSPMMPN